MKYREVRFTFPDGATDRDKVMMVLQSPYSFVRWCRTQVGVAPNTFARNCGDCVVEQYLKSATDVRTCIDYTDIVVCAPKSDRIITPTWVQRVIEYADNTRPFATYNDIANMLMHLLGTGELA